MTEQWWAGVVAGFSLAALTVTWSFLVSFRHLLDRQDRERLTWSAERNALLEKLVPGSTPQLEPPLTQHILGDDEAEWLASVDEETRLAWEAEAANGKRVGV